MSAVTEDERSEDVWSEVEGLDEAAAVAGDVLNVDGEAFVDEFLDRATEKDSGLPTTAAAGREFVKAIDRHTPSYETRDELVEAEWRAVFEEAGIDPETKPPTAPGSEADPSEDDEAEADEDESETAEQGDEGPDEAGEDAFDEYLAGLDGADRSEDEAEAAVDVTDADREAWGPGTLAEEFEMTEPTARRDLLGSIRNSRLLDDDESERVTRAMYRLAHQRQLRERTGAGDSTREFAPKRFDPSNQRDELVDTLDRHFDIGRSLGETRVKTGESESIVDEKRAELDAVAGVDEVVDDVVEEVSPAEAEGTETSQTAT